MCPAGTVRGKIFTCPNANLVFRHRLFFTVFSDRSKRIRAVSSVQSFPLTVPIEGMLIAQMTATHVAMMTATGKFMDADYQSQRNSNKRAMNRCAQTFTAQVDALKRYRAKAQNTVRVEQVTVNDGGQAIVGNVEQSGN
jgi:hypothetical protein